MRAASEFAVNLKWRIQALKGWRAAGLVVLAGALSALAMAPFHISPILFLTMPVLFWRVDADVRRAGRKRAWQAAKTGWFFAFGYHFAGLYWIGFAFLVEAEKFAWLLPFAVLAMPAGLALFWAGAMAVLALRPVCSLNILGRVLVFVIVITATEWLRGHVLTGFPWNTLGYALAMPLELMQLAGLIGIYGMTAFTVLSATVPLVVTARAASHRLPVIAVAALAPLGFAWVYGAWMLSGGASPDVGGVRLRLVQPSISQKDKFVPAKRREILDAHLALTRGSGGANSLKGITHIVWPEAAMPFLAMQEPVALADIGRAVPEGVSVLAGTLRLGKPIKDARGRYRVFNSAIAVNSEGRVAHVYDKVHLVPFGEYLPFQDTLEDIGLEQLTRIRGGFKTGLSPRPFMRMRGLPPAEILICYEAMFPAEVAVGRERPGVLINITNDAWFGVTSGPYQHFHQVRVRAVEQGIPLIRSANNGISAVIGPRGRIAGYLGLNEVGYLDAALPEAIAPTIYARYRGWIEAGIFLIFLLAVYVVGGANALSRWARSSRECVPKVSRTHILLF